MVVEFWIPAAVIVALVAAGLLRAYRTGANVSMAGDPGADRAADLRVYKDQLAEVERDIAKGSVSAEEGGRLRAEVARRLLEADRAHRTAGQPVTAPMDRGAPAAIWPVAAILVALAAGIGGYYFWLGAPGYPDLPLSDRMARATETYNARPSQDAAEAAIGPQGTLPSDPAEAALLTQLREAVAARPDDLRGHQLLAQSEAAIGNLAGARIALQQALALMEQPATPAERAQLAELMIAAAGGIVTPQAEAELVAVLQGDPQNGIARFYSGLMMAQIGRPDQAFALWRGLLESSTPQDPWYEPIRAQIDDLAQAAGVGYAAPQAPAPGPDAADVAAAGEMSAQDRQEMIAGMVAGLEQRLFSNGGTAQDWARLVTSLGVLGETERARAALDAGKAALAGDAAGLSLLEQAAAGLNP